MKRIITLITLIFLLSQSLYSLKFEVSVKGLLGVSSMTRENTSNYKADLSYGIGSGISMLVHNIFTIEIDALLMSRGAKTDQGKPISFSQFSFPILLKSDPFGIGISLIGGIQFNYITRGLLYNPPSSPTKISDQLNKFTYDLILGIGYRVDFLSFELRYELGLTDIIKDNSTFGANIEKNKSVYFIVGVNFDL